MIRQADKGGAFVVWRRDLYIAEANRQPEDQRFYEKIPSDATQSSQQTVQSFINTANRCLHNFIVFLYFYSGIVQINSLKEHAK